ncbi:MFS transporter [Aspergillus similis]
MSRLSTLDSELDTRQNPPDGAYGWICVVAVFFINAHTWGINSCYAVFLSHYLSYSVYPDASPLPYALVGGLSISCGLLVGPLVTLLMNIGGTRHVLNIGVLFQTVALIGASFASQIWHVILSQGICFGMGIGFLFIGSVGIIHHWFDRRRGVAMGITASGSGIGGLIYSLGVGAMIPNLGLEWTFRFLAMISVATGARPTSFHLALLKQPQFLLFIAWGVFSMLGYVTLLFSMSDYAVSIGLTPKQASIVSALLNLGQGLGRTFIGFSSDRFGRLNIASLFTFLCGLFCLVIWIFAESMGVLCFFVLLAGSIAGTYFATVSPVLAEIVPLKDLFSALSANWLFLVAPTLVAEPIALVLRDGDSNAAYLPVQIFVGFMYIGAAVCLWVVRAWKVQQLNNGEQSDISGDDGAGRDGLNCLNGTWGFTKTVGGAVAVEKL